MYQMEKVNLDERAQCGLGEGANCAQSGGNGPAPQLSVQDDHRPGHHGSCLREHVSSLLDSSY